MTTSTSLPHWKGTWVDACCLDPQNGNCLTASWEQSFWKALSQQTTTTTTNVPSKDEVVVSACPILPPP
eukprot:CAMPEP_0172459408 /NCGR_PEP_ID=MMETSP1065-20121228/32569_1 /TAXON_ID=265537 /ORGANISM="Amphiprora paludosa, Strain CCMP125" /LENGTH=68 /DNA_ID=CAMNT_0013214081 /DNA_START=36 /DNA_END=238 /DNA_ORIENTATION=-